MTARPPAGTLRRVKIATIAIALLATAIAAAPASADSIVYAKQGNLYLTSADGSKGYQLTFDGGYSSPSQAEDGTIGALRHKQLVRMNRSGQLLNAPIEAMGSDGTHADRRAVRAADLARRDALRLLLLRPDVHRRPTSTTSAGSTPAPTARGRGRTTSRARARRASTTRTSSQTEWVTNDRLLGTLGMYLNMWTWKLGTGHGYTYEAAQWWFGLQDPPDEWGVARLPLVRPTRR